MVQWLGLHAFTAEGVGSIPVWGTKDPTSWGGAAKKKKKKSHRECDSALPPGCPGFSSGALETEKEKVKCLNPSSCSLF